MEMITEAIGIHTNPHTLKTDSGAGITRTEVGWCDCGFLGTGEIYSTRGRDWAEWKKTG